MAAHTDQGEPERTALAQLAALVADARSEQRAAITERDRLIVVLSAPPLGLSARILAEPAGVTFQHVSRIVKRAHKDGLLLIDETATVEDLEQAAREVEQARVKVEDAITERDREIRAETERWTPTRVVGDTVGVGHSRVVQIVSRS